jgi:hypothetical protein
MNDWLAMNKQLPTLTETQLVDELAREQDGLARARFLLRLHQRYSRIRAGRERMALLKSARAV